MASGKTSNAFVWIIMLLLIAGLAGFGLTSFGGSARAVATVGDSEIDVEDYARALEGQIRTFQGNTGQALTVDQARAIGLDRIALGQLISERALENASAQAGLSVGDENISEAITSIQAFHGLGGTFDRQTYELALQQNGIRVSDFEDRMRQTTSANILRSAVAGGVEIPTAFVDTLYNFARESRDVTWARLSEVDLETPLAEPTDGELQEFYTANPEPFTLGETRVIDYALLTPDMIVDQIDVDEAQLRELYDAASDQYNLPERRLVERLVFTTDQDALAALTRINDGEVTFAALVAERGLTLDDVDQGEVSMDDLGDAGAAVFALTEPGVVGPAPSSLGPALYQMNAILAARATSFEDARAELETQAAADRARRIIADSIVSVEDLLAGGANVADLAERTDMQAGQIDWRVDVLDGVAAYQGFRTAAATAQEGAFAEITELEDGGIVVVSLQEIRPPEVLPFDAVQSDVVALWEEDATGKALAAQAEGLADRLRTGAEMAGLGLILRTDRNMERSSFVEGTPPDFTDQVFDMSAGEIRVINNTGEAWLIRLDDIRAPDATSPEAQVIRRQFSQETSAELTQSVLDAFTQAVLDETDVQVNSSALNLVHSSGH